MENKLQELTRKLYDEGLEKGRAEATQLVEDARKEAAAILRDADAKASETLAQAQRQADELRRDTRSEVALAAQRSIDALKEQVADLVSARALDKPLGELALDADFLGQLIARVAGDWDAAVITLPQELEAKFDAATRGSLEKILGQQHELRFGSGAPSGFSIAPKQGGYRVDFTQSAFRALVERFLRPKVAELLWNDPTQ